MRQTCIPKLLVLFTLMIAGVAEASPALEARSAVLMNLKSGSVLFAQNEGDKIPPASLAKIMTLYLLMDAVQSGDVSLSDDVKISKRAAIQPGSRMNLREGEVVSLEELAKGAAVASGNDASVAISEHVGGTLEAFVKRMNEKAAEMGMKDTVFRNPNGLPSSGQITSARDMLTLSRRYIEDHPEALPYHSLLEITHRKTTTTNKNPLLRTHPVVDGLKTGWIQASKHNLIATARSGDIRLVAVVLGAPTSRDLADSSGFLIDAGFRTVESGGKWKVAEQLAQRGSPDMAPAAAEKQPDAPAEPSRVIATTPTQPTPTPEPDTPKKQGAPGAPKTPAETREAGSMREIHAEKIADAVARLCIDANYQISADIKQAFARSLDAESDDLSRDVMSQLIENADIAAEGNLPLCQDTGMAVVFVQVGQDVRITGGSLRDAVNEGVRRGYRDGYLRASVVSDPIDRANTGDNTPAVIHFDIVPGDKLKIVMAPKGFGSENMSRLAMLKPSDGIAGVKNFVVETVKLAGPNPCPPIVVGVGVGGTMEQAALMAKRALLRPVDSTNPSWLWRGIEGELLDAVNALGIGPAGFGGRTTALAVHIETYPTHIAGLPVAVNIGCHATRHAEVEL